MQHLVDFYANICRVFTHFHIFVCIGSLWYLVIVCRKFIVMYLYLVVFTAVYATYCWLLRKPLLFSTQAFYVFACLLVCICSSGYLIIFYRIFIAMYWYLVVFTASYATDSWFFWNNFGTFLDQLEIFTAIYATYCWFLRTQFWFLPTLWLFLYIYWYVLVVSDV